MEKIVRLATKNDVDSVKAFLQKVDIEISGLEDYIEYFVLMEDDQQNLLATVGFQPIDGDGLLRSLVVTPSLKERDILVLFQAIMTVAEEKGMRHLYLATNKTASISFFELLKFREILYNQLPSCIREGSYIEIKEKGPSLHIMEYTL
ncbi:GNAT family N-acetyltransferase [Bacillus songklensis]|uniref:GNAT family N-acetyltransferase n=1 Tax=Bacillus songklensis TaxID=1069116 RepID=A0ABV8B7V3_9BACI